MDIFRKETAEAVSAGSAAAPLQADQKQEDEYLTIALTKGRLASQTMELLGRAGF